MGRQSKEKTLKAGEKKLGLLKIIKIHQYLMPKQSGRFKVKLEGEVNYRLLKYDEANNRIVGGLKKWNLWKGIEPEKTILFFTLDHDGVLNISITDPAIEQTASIINDFETERRNRLINSFNRNPKLVKELKEMYNNICQVCGVPVKSQSNQFYSEVHHIIPLGNNEKLNKNIDIKENMIVVCPNCHVQLDLFWIPLIIERFKSYSHDISEGSIKYHNNKVF